ncbi:MAG: response regulator transcription factor [Bacilli bacterium]|nr:response regulator transcription factor [Bacilli bacterium]
MRILVVEDEYKLSDMVSDRLRKEKYTVDVANDGETGLYKALDGIYDLVILDIMLPKVNGIDILKEIRSNNINSKVIMLTAKGELDDKLLGFKSGANDYISKPFHIDELVARVNVQLRNNIEENKDVTYGDLILNIDKSEIINKDTQESVSIINKEFQLLEYFMRNPEQVLSKEMIYDKVWGMDNESFSNNLEAYLSFIRKKLKLIDSKVNIKSLRNLGYKMVINNEELK